MLNFYKNLFFSNLFLWEELSWKTDSIIDDKNKSENDDLLKYIDLNSLDKTQLSKLNEVKDKINEVKKRLEWVEAWLQVVWKTEWKLSDWVDNQLTLQEKSSPDADKIREDILRFKNELKSLEHEKMVLIRTLTNYANNHLNEDEIKTMQSISNKEFLKYPNNERLRFVTVWNVDFNQVETWNVSSLEFTFTFDWKFNDELYMKTTAWQVLPNNAREINVDWMIYDRRWLSWEFFNQAWERLIIKEWTKIDVVKLASKEEMSLIESELGKKLEEYWDWINQEIAIETLKKWYDPKIIIELFSDEYSKIDNNLSKKVFLEEKLTQIARYEDLFFEQYWNQKQIMENWKMSTEFVWFITWFFDNSKIKVISEKLWYDLSQLQAFTPTEIWGWKIDMSNINIDGLTKEQIDLILEQKKFKPFSKEAIILLTSACQSAWLPPEWWKSEALHNILAKESNWVVWRLNYTIKWVTQDQFKDISNSSRSDNPLWVRSTASWLGQLLLSNVDIYYPDWRAWIWDALNEAVWFIRYIKDRYWSPDVAWGIYWKVWNYTHPEKWVQYKWFREWY